MVKTKDKTASIIEAMLKENTGAHFLDSGSAYGRNYERNQERDFAKENACQVSIDTWKDNEGKEQNDLSISFNLYHYLNAYLDYDDTCRKLKKEFDAFAELPENKDESWLGLMEEFADRFTNYGTTNTYNFDNILSQTIQYTMFSLTDDEYDVYILLQIHGGCDVRGGYTKPRIFKVTERDYFLMAMNNIYAYCNSKQGHNWQSDDSGYYFYFDGSTARNEEFDWSKIKISNGKVICPCGGEIHFAVMDSY